MCGQSNIFLFLDTRGQVNLDLDTDTVCQIYYPSLALAFYARAASVESDETFASHQQSNISPRS